MTRGTSLLLFASLIVANSAIAEDRLRSHPLRKSTDAFFRNYQKIGGASDDDPAPGSASDKLMKRIDATPIGVRPLFMLLPTDTTKPKQETARNALAPPSALTPAQVTADVTPPTFALVARATGGTLVSLTRPGSQADPRDHQLFQRTLVSDLFQNRSVSVSVYEDHALDGDALRFLGIGGRVTPRPTVKIFGWRVRLDLFGSFHPEHGATGYAAVTGAPEFTPMPAGVSPSSAGVLPVAVPYPPPPTGR